MTIKEAKSASELDTIISESKNPVLVDFYADWCGPCKVMDPILKKYSDNNESVDIVKVDIELDANNDAVKKFSIMSIPAFKLFNGGEEAATFIGSMSLSSLEDKISATLNGGNENARV